MNTATMRAGRPLILGFLIASVLGLAALWLATASPTIDAPPDRGGAEPYEFTCIQAPWDVVLNHGEGQQAGGELPIDYRKTEIACDDAGRRQFAWAIGAGVAGALVGLAGLLFALAARRESRSES